MHFTACAHMAVTHGFCSYVYVRPFDVIPQHTGVSIMYSFFLFISL